jgi:general secretion pathway protein H
VKTPTSPRRTEKALKGFSLIEMLLVLVIAGLAAALIGPRLAVREPPAREIAARAAATLERARAAALREGREVEAAFDLAERRLDLGEAGPSLAWPASADIAIESASERERDGARFGVRFYPDGASSGLVARIRTDTSEAGLRVEWLTGAVSVTP